MASIAVSSSCHKMQPCLCLRMLCFMLADLMTFAASQSCKCRPGYGTSSGALPCELCPVSTYSEGGGIDKCKPCPFGYSSKPGAESIAECEKVYLSCPANQIAPPGAISAEACACLPGFGGECANLFNDPTLPNLCCLAASQLCK